MTSVAQAPRHLVGQDRRELPRWRLRGRAHKAALTVHVLTSVGWFGVAAALACGVVVATATSDHALSSAIYRTMELAPWLSIPAGLASAATGVVLGLGTAHGLIQRWWVVAKIGVNTAVVVTDAVLITHFAHQAAVTGHVAPPLRGAAIAHVVALVVATVLSVFKPWGRTPWARRRPT
jgi:hypothetical protein